MMGLYHWLLVNALLLPDNQNTILNGCLNKVWLKYFRNRDVFILESSHGHIPLLDYSANVSYTQLIVTHEFYIQTLQTEALINKHIYRHINLLERKHKFFLWLVHDLSKFEADVLELQAQYIVHSQCRLLMILKNTGSVVNVQSLWTTIWKNLKVLNTTIIVSYERKVEIFTKFPYFPNRNELVLLDVYENNSFQNDCNVFPKKVALNFKGNILKIGFANSVPYVINYKDLNVNGRGVEVRLIETIAEHLQFTTEIINLPLNGHPREIMSDSGVVKGFAGLLVHNEADICAAGFATSFPRFIVNDFLGPYFEDSVVWLIPKTVITNSLSSFTRIFHLNTWLTILASIVNVWLLVWMYSKIDFFRFWGCILEQPFGAVPQLFILKSLVLVYLFFCIIISAAYRGALFRSVTIVNEVNLFNTPAEVAEAGWITYLYPIAKAAYNETDHQLWNQILIEGHFRYEMNTSKIFEAMLKDRKVMTLLVWNPTKYSLSSYGLDSEGKLPFQILMKDRTFMPSVFLSPGNPLTDRFRQEMHKLIDGGFVNHWFHQIMEDSKVKSLRVNNDFHKKETVKSFTVPQLAGAFLFYLAGLVLSVSVLVIEIFLYHDFH